MAKVVCKMGQEASMSGECTKCLKEKGVQDFLKTLDSVEAAESFTYMQWVTVDRCNLVKVRVLKHGSNPSLFFFHF